MDEFLRMDKEKNLIRQLREKYKGVEKPGVSILLPTSKIKFLDNIYENLKRIDYPQREVILLVNGRDKSLKPYIEHLRDFSNIRFFLLNERYTLGDCLNYGIEKAKYNYIAKIDDDDYYGTHFLSDLMIAFNFTDAEIVGKGVQFVYFAMNNALGIRLPIAKPFTPEEGKIYENRYCLGPCLSGGTLVIKKEVFAKVRFPSINLGEDVKFLEDCTEQKFLIYASDRYNYVYMRHRDKTDHTWNVSSEYVYNQSYILDITRDYVSIVTV